MNKYDLPDVLYKAIKDVGGKATIIEICKHIWQQHSVELQRSGDLFYTWQYDIRWAATELRKNQKMKTAEQCPKGVWEIV